MSDEYDDLYWPCGKSRENWHEMSEAPTDSSRILVYRDGYAEDHAICFWSDDYLDWVAVLSGHTFHNATLWTEIPW